MDGVAQVLMQHVTGNEQDVLIGIERWEIGSKTYVAADALAALPDNVEKPLAEFLVELVGQAALAAPMDIVGA